MTANNVSSSFILQHPQSQVNTNSHIVFNALPREDFEMIIGDKQRRKVVMANR